MFDVIMFFLFFQKPNHSFNRISGGGLGDRNSIFCYFCLDEPEE